MNPKDWISVPLSYEYMMSFLFGNWNYHGHVGTLLANSWKKDLVKINKYIKKAICLNVISDGIQQKMLNEECDRFSERLKEVKSIDGMNVAFVECYTRLIFQLLGNFPNHWERKAPWSDRFWDLSGHRTFQYSQTDEQKTYLIINAVDIRKKIKIKVKGFKDMHEAFYQGSKGNGSKFIEWFKENYPKEYCQLF